MMRPEIERYILGQLTSAIDKEMRRNTQLFQVFKKGMGRIIETVAEKIINVAAAKFARRQTDIVNYQQADFFPFGPFTQVW